MGASVNPPGAIVGDRVQCYPGIVDEILSWSRWSAGIP